MKEDGILAQVVEHLTFNQVVAGSSPAYLIAKQPGISDMEMPGF